ncbi:hypothetical protein ACFQ3R_04675 [Mesonia ostreae]|uniref:Uncharacterized protein n=1 Tax=Mesonia ostreae TaxID=861110 RepID=A0ABU2KK72_9FLAO|nr:hypothetical protein [Mesonia ostreae]MDT0295108.1 hypothetical protein [Mesonia ostreae]
MDRILNTRSTMYSSSLSDTDLRDALEKLFKEKKLKFIGKFKSLYEFEAYDTWTYITWYVPNMRRQMAYLKGKIIKSEKGSILNLNLKPNPVIAIFPILLISIGIIISLIALFQNEISIFGMVLIAVGIVFYLFGVFLKNRLERNFQKHLDLQKM